jgi:hypothetical protein
VAGGTPDACRQAGEAGGWASSAQVQAAVHLQPYEASATHDGVGDAGGKGTMSCSDCERTEIDVIGTS